MAPELEQRLPRLFVAIELPPAALEALVRIQPPPTPGIRPVPADRIHLTLHFLGEAEVEPVAAALQEVAGSRFSFDFETVGRFRSFGGGAILWAGVRRNQKLADLHSAAGNVLAHVGFRPERRPYSPHITLARCKPHAPAEVISAFLAQNRNFRVAEVPVASFTLFSSVLAADGPLYRRERVFPLAEVPPTPPIRV